MSETTLPATPNLPSFAARLINMGAEKILTTGAVALAGWGAIQPSQEAQFVAIGSGLILYGVSWLVGFIKTRVQHKAAVALANAPAVYPPIKA